MKKTIVIFANSIKHGKHCVAGKDIHNCQWIRPVRDTNGSELDHKQCMCVNPHGKFKVKPLQKVEIDIISHSPLIHQPENYLIGNGEWKQKYKIDLSEITKFLDKPDSLWGKGDKISFFLIENGKINIDQSLYLVKVSNLKIYRTANNRRKTSFFYNGYHYNLSVTDPNFDELMKTSNFRGILCVSLGEKFRPDNSRSYFCYKIVVAIF